MSFKRTLIASSLMILTMVCVSFFSYGEDVSPKKPLSNFPRRIGNWIGKEGHFDQRIYDILRVDDSFLGHYRTVDGHHVQLYIGYFKTQRQGEQIHSPKNCLPGAGWNIVRTSLEDLVIPNTNPGKIRVVKLYLEKGDQRQLVLYWFQSRGRFIHSEYKRKIYLVWDAILKNRTDGSFIRLIAPIDKDEADTTEHITSFAQQLIPIVSEYVPGA